MFTKKKTIFSLIKIVIICYSGIGIFLFYFQDKILFSSQYKIDSHPIFNTPVKHFSIPINLRDTLHVIQFLPTDSIRLGNVIYFQEKSQSGESFESNVKLFTEKGFSVWMIDYFDCKDENRQIAESKLYSAAYQLKQLAKSNNPSSTLIIYGKEFGSAIAANLSGMLDVDQLILESPLVSIPDYFSCKFPIYPWNSMARLKMKTAFFLKDVHTSVIIFSNKKNKQFAQAMKTKDSYVIIDSYKADGIAETDAYKKTISMMIEKISVQSK